MFKLSPRCFVAGAACVFLLTASSALAASPSRRATNHAARSHGRAYRGRSHGLSHKQASPETQPASSVLEGSSSTFLLGNEEVQSYRDYLGSGSARAFRFQAAAAGTASTLDLYVDAGTTAAAVFVGLYSNVAGRPGSLLSSGVDSAPMAGAWNSVALSAGAVQPGATYWLSILSEGGTLRYRDRRHGPCPSASSAQVNLTALPSPWRTRGITRGCPVSAYVTAEDPIAPVSPTEPITPVEPPPLPPPVEPVPPPAAPSNTAAPTITGTALQNHPLTSTTGTWTGSPTSYAYAWQHCNTSGRTCVAIGGATSHSYELASSDVGHRLRVVVTAGNSGGSHSATSQMSAVVAAALIAPASTGLPTIGGTAEEGKTLTAGPGSWSGSPGSTAYQWQTCNPSGTSCVDAEGETGQSYQLTSADVGETVRVVVTTSNSAGSASATSAATAVVVDPPVVLEPPVLEPPVVEPPPVNSPPASIVLPKISGTAVAGQTLTATTGSWSNSPTGYAYQWQDCTPLSVLCANVNGATKSTYALGGGDVGETVRVVVTASNAGGSVDAASGVTATVGEAGGESANCIDNLAACGYPDPSSSNVGPGVPCSSLTPAGDMTITKSGTTVQNMNISGQVAIDASNVTLTHDCITNDGGGEGGSAVVMVEHSGVGAQIDYSDISGANNTSGSVEEAVRTNYANMNTTVDHDYLYNCGECFHGAGTLTNSYVTANAEINPGQSDEDHYEGIYYGGGAGPLVVEHDTIIDPHDQTAAIFVSHDFGDVTTLTITNNVLEGGDYVIYGGGSGSAGSVVGPVTVTGNRFSTKNYSEGGQYGPEQYFNEAVTTWSGNIWDSTLAVVPFG